MKEFFDACILLIIMGLMIAMAMDIHTNSESIERLENKIQRLQRQIEEMKVEP